MSKSTEFFQPFQSNMEKFFNFAIKLGTGISIISAIGYSSLFTVDGGEAAVIWDMKNGKILIN